MLACLGIASYLHGLPLSRISVSFVSPNSELASLSATRPVARARSLGACTCETSSRNARDSLRGVNEAEATETRLIQAANANVSRVMRMLPGRKRSFQVEVA